MLSLLRMISGAVVLACGMGQAAGGPFSSLLVFGDSLSDVGNVDSIFLSPYPGDGYWNGRFSNGPVYAEALATGLGLPTLTRSTAGGNNYAYGGAQTSGTGGLEGLFINDVDEQIDLFLDSRTVDPNSLVVVFAGANDLFNGETNMNVPVGNLTEDLGRLINEGGRQFLVPNLPLLGNTPSYNSNASTKDTFNTRTTSFNSLLSLALDGLEATHPEVIFFRLDVARLFDELISNPTAYGLTNVTQQAAAALEPGQFFYNDDNVVENPHEYLFWDSVHPTAVGHQLFADRALDLVGLPGDFNRDGVVDAADYTVWRNQLGATVSTGTGADADGDGTIDHRDYTIWKSYFGLQSSVLTAQLRSVPEPAGIALLLVSLAGMGAKGCHRHRGF